MRTKLPEVGAHAKRAGRGLVLLGLVGAAAACELPGMPDGAFEPLVYRERDQLRQASQPNPPPVIAGLAGGAGASVPTLAAGAPAGVTQEMVEEGAQLFGTVCSACHGAGGVGTPAGPQLSDAEWLNVTGEYDQIVGVIQTGVPSPQQFPAAMPPMGGGSFDEGQVRALAAYVFALSHQ